MPRRLRSSNERDEAALSSGTGGVRGFMKALTVGLARGSVDSSAFMLREIDALGGTVRFALRSIAAYSVP